MGSWPIGVFSSIDEGLGVRWDVLSELKIPTIQLHAPGPEHRNPDAATRLRRQLDEMNVRCTAVFGGFAGESYADIPTTAATVGLVPRSTRQSRTAEMKAISDFAQAMGCDVVALHLGFIPDDDSETQSEIVSVTREICDHAADNGQTVHLETGQETAEGLLHFLSAVDRNNLKINFDPANMILYGTGHPIEALRQVGHHVGSVHCKDAKWSDQPGVTWGTEVPLGEGDVNMRLYLETLNQIGYAGPLTIEREIPEDPQRQREEILAAADLLSSLRDDILG